MAEGPGPDRGARGGQGRRPASTEFPRCARERAGVIPRAWEMARGLPLALWHVRRLREKRRRVS